MTAEVMARVPASVVLHTMEETASSKQEQEVTDLETLHQVTSCGLTAQQAKLHIKSVSVANQGAQLAFWPPALCTFAALHSINLSGNAITSIPQSVQALTGLQVLNVARNSLTALPPEISCLTSLTELDVGRNQLAALPPTLCSLSQLQVLNVYSNQLKVLPQDLGSLRSLIRLGLKSNQLAELPRSFTQLTSLVELFLTDNLLTTLPEGFGNLRSLVKLQASFNPFTHLPADLWRLPALELFRLAVGQLRQWPAGLAEADSLPMLAWCSIGRNPAAVAVPAVAAELPRVDRWALQVGEKLGQGASGEVFLGVYEGRSVAVKIFIADVSPDGSTAEEMAINCAVRHPNLTRVLALVTDTQQQQQQQQQQGEVAAPAAAAAGDAGAIVGLVLELVHGKPLADRPTSRHLLRCKWGGDVSFSLPAALSICHGVAGALAYLHSLGIAHGDVYAHNIMADGQARPVVCDFGASFCYSAAADPGRFFERMEVRAFGLFMGDVVARISEQAGVADGASQQLRHLVQQCLAGSAMQRPLFALLEQQLLGLMQQQGVGVPAGDVQQ
ncbi:hypothetical protein COO60DRAFT_1698969 [Scenedesmus sp. NREL 46B-D3]|nr:hypothetical protein COO60DRAFT_1698969 [Scenedesmus sp. NREL 46B-D3]